MGAPSLSQKIIVVIGGTTGLGFSAARAMLAAGAKDMFITGQNPENAQTAAASLGARCAAYAGDQFGGFDALYHVAGASGRRFGDGPLHEITDEGLKATPELNLHSVILSNRAAVRQFLSLSALSSGL
jgi:NAD(P)-dependent dehydrogenase (short-subunit alcohol dehydrogenase family)